MEKRKTNNYFTGKVLKNRFDGGRAGVLYKSELGWYPKSTKKLELKFFMGIYRHSLYDKKELGVYRRVPINAI